MSIPPPPTPYEQACEYLSSSDKLYAGIWVPTDIVFPDATPTITARVPILAATSVTTCSSWENVVLPGCTCNTVPAPVVTPNPSGIRLMGIGFGRQPDGQPQGNPDKNPILNVVRIGTLDLVPTSSFRNGHIITRTGIDVGLTAANMARFAAKTIELERPPVWSDPRDWLPVPACITAGSGTCFQGAGLIDTGVNQSYMHTYDISPRPARTTFPYLDAGVQIHWKFGASAPYAVSEDITVGDASDIVNGITPWKVSLWIHNVGTPRVPRVNTGRHLLRKWNVAFDAIGGHFAFALA